MSDFLPCPFCGQRPRKEVTKSARYTYWLCCANEKCTVRPRSLQYLKEEEAEAAWNRRTHSPLARGLAEALERSQTVLRNIPSMPGLSDEGRVNAQILSNDNAALLARARAEGVLK